MQLTLELMAGMKLTRMEEINMNIIKKVTIDMLTDTSVSILTQNFVEIDGVEMQVDKNHRKAYVNTESGRNEIENEQEESTINAVFSIWGDNPTVINSEQKQETESE